MQSKHEVEFEKFTTKMMQRCKRRTTWDSIQKEVIFSQSTLLLPPLQDSTILFSRKEKGFGSVGWRVVELVQQLISWREGGREGGQREGSWATNEAPAATDEAPGATDESQQMEK